MEPAIDRPIPASRDRQAGPSVAPGVGLSARSAAIIAGVGLSMLLVNLGRPWVLTFHEVNYAQPAREFLASGDWLVPRIMGMPNWDKPPLMHWSIAASFALFGTEAEWAARLPAVLSAVLSSLAIAWLAARWHGDRVGLITGLVQSTSVYVFKQGRLAEADMMLCAASTVAMVAFLSGVAGREGRRAGWGMRLLFFGAAGLAFLVKGPVGLALIGAGSGLGAIVERRRLPWRFLLDPVGWILMSALVIGWPLAAMIGESGLVDVWWRHNVDRFSGDMGGGDKDPFFYLYTAAWLALPWTPIAVFGLLADSKRARQPEERSQRRMLICWLAGMAGLLSLSAWKHTHYIIPALPPLSIWAAIGLDRLSRGMVPTASERWAKLWRALVEFLPIVAIGGIAAGVSFAGEGRGTAAAAGVAAGLAGLGIWASDRFRRIGKSTWALGVLFAAAWGAYVAVQSLAMPEVDDYRGQSELAARLSKSLPPGADLSVVAIPDPQVTYYLPIPVRRHDDVGSLALWLDDADRNEMVVGPRITVIGPQLILETLDHLGQVRVLDRANSVHPRKKEEDRMIAASLEPDLDRIRAIIRQVKHDENAPEQP